MDKDIKIMKKLNFYLVLCSNKSEFEKYVKLKKIRKKCIIDIQQLLVEEELTVSDLKNTDYVKILILKLFTKSIEAKRDIYYVPYVGETDYTKLFNIRNILTTHSFNLLCFSDELEPAAQSILDNLDLFDKTELFNVKK